MIMIMMIVMVVIMYVLSLSLSLSISASFLLFIHSLSPSLLFLSFLLFYCMIFFTSSNAFFFRLTHEKILLTKVLGIKNSD